MTLLLDMNLPPSLASALAAQGVEAAHWSKIGDQRATDATIMAYARDHDCVVVTRDMDFTSLLWQTKAAWPSVIHVRTEKLLGASLCDALVAVARRHASALSQGSIVTLSESNTRIRVLPLGVTTDSP